MPDWMDKRRTSLDVDRCDVLGRLHLMLLDRWTAYYGPRYCNKLPIDDQVWPSAMNKEHTGGDGRTKLNILETRCRGPLGVELCSLRIVYRRIQVIA